MSVKMYYRNRRERGAARYFEAGDSDCSDAKWIDRDTELAETEEMECRNQRFDLRVELVPGGRTFLPAPRRYVLSSWRPRAVCKDG